MFSLLLLVPALAQAQLAWVTNNGAVVITGYAGLGGAATISGTINGLRVTSIGEDAFSFCDGLLAITVDPANPGYSSAGGVLLDESQTTLIEYPTHAIWGRSFVSQAASRGRAGLTPAKGRLFSRRERSRRCVVRQGLVCPLSTIAATT